MTIFRARDLNDDEEYSEFTTVTRKHYKRVINDQDSVGNPIRVGTSYVDGTPVKSLTLLRRPWS